MKRNFALKKYNRKFLITCALLTEITFGAGLYWVYKRLQKSSDFRYTLYQNNLEGFLNLFYQVNVDSTKKPVITLDKDINLWKSEGKRV